MSNFKNYYFFRKKYYFHEPKGFISSTIICVAGIEVDRHDMTLYLGVVTIIAQFFFCTAPKQLTIQRTSQDLVLSVHNNSTSPFV